MIQRWALVPRILLRRSRSNPLITASTTMSAMTPRATPPIEISVIREINACPRLAFKYRSPTNSSNGIRTALFALGGLQERKKDDITNGWGVGQEHRQPVDADPFARRRRHPVLQRPQIIFIQTMSFEIALIALPQLIKKAGALLAWIVQLRVGVRDFHPTHEQLKPLNCGRLVGFRLRQGGELGGKINDKRRLNQPRLHQRIEQLSQYLPPTPARQDMDPIAFGRLAHTRFCPQHLRIKSGQLDERLIERQFRPGRSEGDLEDGLVFFDTVSVFYQFNNNKHLANYSVVSFYDGML